MKSCCFLMILVLGGGLLVPLARAQVADPSAGPQTPAAQPIDRLTVCIQAIRDATDPSSAIAAYARAVADVAGAGSIPQPLLEAYVYRMVQFYLPEAAYQQARMLVDANPNDGIAWGVMSFVAARHGQMAEALADAMQAASRMPDNRFVQETVGQVLAWYDLSKPTVSDSLRDSIQRVRSQLEGQQSFADAYQDAMNDLQGPRTRSSTTTRPATSPPAGQQVYQAPAEESNYSDEPLPQPLYSSLEPYLPDGFLNIYPEYPQGIYYPSLVYAAPYCAPDWCWWNSWWPYGPNFPQHNTIVVNPLRNPQLFRLGHLLFEREHGKFEFVGIDRNRGGWQAAANRASVSGGASRPPALGQAPVDRAPALTHASQSRVFSPGYAPGRLTFGRSAVSGLAQGSTQTGISIHRDAWSGVPQASAQSAQQVMTVSPNDSVESQRTNSYRVFGYNRSSTARGPATGWSGGSDLSSMRTSSLAPRGITTVPGSVAPRIYSPAPQFGGFVSSAPRMDVSRSIAPSFAAPRSFGSGFSGSVSGFSGGGRFADGGSMGAGHGGGMSGGGHAGGGGGHR